MVTITEHNEWLWRGYTRGAWRMREGGIHRESGVRLLAEWVVKGEANGDFVKGLAMRYAQG